MKVGIITCHDVYNYGSSLQAYALSKKISQFCDVEIINYKPDYLFRLFDFMEVDSDKWKRNVVTRWIYRLYVAPIKLCQINRYRAFKSFNKLYLPLSKKYSSFDELKNSAKYDKYVCGSDQIWNSSKYLCGEDPSFFLAFTDAEKIAYAASFGGTVISEIGKENIINFLPSFSAISVRENSGVDILRQYGLNSVHVLDPVFFFSGEEWRKIEKKPRNIPDDYIFVYGYDNSDDYLKMIEEYQNENLLQLNSHTLDKIGPSEFLWLIDHAKTVITTSFHAVSFSIIFHTQFVTAKTQNTELYERLESIMSLCGLEDRRYDILKRQNNWKEKKIDYSAVDSKLAEAKKKSIDFLVNALGENDDK